ncbi:hypothetical protein [Pseudoteredinibacter isoporae]|uniref:Uncharacterized protein n=1 Tax=Pseudoteredinibacter isoporae TaxID=570281 RepID=A0A7X0MXN5_9GAMM|nr:hypothetical protein [Pseudoteredinibacter isoporae]MBB6523410.1 hypothetical protein [Pseudoteredinibacter isoporae]NHO88921.1 hypothetical protein [Pseudoteredinibacter isoporae]NIB24371.1 hypothetical protein [Pseudoteredinibacter isoporae]
MSANSLFKRFKNTPTTHHTLLVLAFAAVSAQSSFAQSRLENPVAKKVESGVSVISGWHCTAQDIEVFIDGKSIGMAGTGTQRPDTESECGHSESGFSLLYNYGSLHEGNHSISVYADGELFAQRVFNTLRPAGPLTEFDANLAAKGFVYDFPRPGDALELEWETAKQAFTARKSYRNAINSGFMVVNFNRTFWGYGRGMKRGEEVFPLRDSSEFEFTLSRQAFNLTRLSDTFGQCTYSGNIEFNFAGVYSEGNYQCPQENGRYSANLSVNASDGHFSGRFSLTPQGSQESYKDVVMGIAP